MDRDETRSLRTNYIFNVLDGGFFGLTLGLASFSTVIPLFVSSLTQSAVLIGLIPAIQNIGWQIPQLLTAKQVSRMEQFKPAVMLITIHERLPFLALAMIAWFLPQLDHRVALILTYATLVWFGLGGGFVANPWLNLLGKIFPGDILGTFLGVQSSALSLFGSLGAFLAGLMLQANPGSRGFALCFFAASGAALFSYLCLDRTIEVKRSYKPEVAEDHSIFRNALGILRTNIPFKWFLVTRMVSQFCLMGFTFYIVYAVRNLGVNEITAGIMTSVYFITQVIANPVLGLISDRINRLLALEIGAAAGTASALIAFLAMDSSWMILALVFAGIANTAFSTIAMAFSLEFSNEIDRPTYIGMANTLIAPSTIIAPLLGGWLADSTGFQATFLLASAAGLLTFLCYFFLVNKNMKKLII
jgi:MFS family permease